MIRWLCKEYESIFEDGSGNISAIRGKAHEYPGMTLDYTVRGQVRIMMFSYIENILTIFEKSYSKGKGMKSSVVPNNVFMVNKYCQKTGSGKSCGFPQSSGEAFVCY